MRLRLDPPEVALEPGRYTAPVAPPATLLALLAQPEVSRFMNLYGVAFRVLHRLPRRASDLARSRMTVHRMLGALHAADQTVHLYSEAPRLQKAGHRRGRSAQRTLAEAGRR